jgi:hypothetical protein
MAILKRGLAGEPVKALQQKLGVPTDGEFGPGTEAALKNYQQENGLTVDGVAGPDTFTRMGLYELVQLKVGTSGEAVKSCSRRLVSPRTVSSGPAPKRRSKTSSRRTGLLPTALLDQRRSRK